jgi:hypothetical protein
MERAGDAGKVGGGEGMERAGDTGKRGGGEGMERASEAGKRIKFGTIRRETRRFKFIRSYFARINTIELERRGMTIIRRTIATRHFKRKIKIRV